MSDDKVDLFTRRDALESLNRNEPLGRKLKYLHEVLQQRFAFVDRVSVALYDPATDMLQTYLHSSGSDNPLTLYQARLADAPNLKEILEQGRPRLVNNLGIFAAGDNEHTQRIAKQRYEASYTLPIFNNNAFVGFVFFNSYTRDAFDEEALHFLDVYGHLASLLVVNELSSIQTMMAALKTARRFTNERDFETGMHLDRMSRYARLIARALAEQYQLSDEYVEHVFLFAPLHDLGKIGIPDSILLKPGKLSANEYTIMKTHVERGRVIIDDLLQNFGLESIQHADVLRHIALHHHEAMDGTGYPMGLRGDAIPLEARIVTVADIFDALTSERPYKKAWSNDEAFAALERLSGSALDSDCVAALKNNRSAVESIQAQFQDDPYG